MNNEDNGFQINKRVWLELFWFPVIGAVWLLLHLNIENIVGNKAHLEQIEFLVGWIMFGLVHVLASNILSFLYNLQRRIMPFSFLKPPLATPKRLKILGGIIMAVSVILMIVAMLKR